MKDPREPNKKDAGFSRRAFLRGSGATAAVSALGSMALPTVPEAEAAATPPEGVQGLGPNTVRISMTVNGRQMTTNVEPRVTLLDALRNHLDVTGCKRVCDRGTCGACTIMLDGRVVYACSMLAVEADGKVIQTAESLINDNGTIDRVPAAIAQFDASQCGFCTPGFVVAMKAVFEQNQRPTPQQVEEGLSGNICRCGTYEQMRDSIYNLCDREREG